MSLYKVAYNSGTKEARILADATTTIPAGFVVVGSSFVIDDQQNQPGHKPNKALYDHVARRLAKLSITAQNMQIVHITLDTGVNIPLPVT